MRLLPLALASLLALPGAFALLPGNGPFSHLECPGPTLEHPLERCNLRATAHTGPGNEVEVAVDPRDGGHVVVVAKGYNQTRMAFHPDGSPNLDTMRPVITPYGATFDGGLTWTEGYLQDFTPQVPLVAGWALGSVDTQESDPVVDITPDGAIIAVTLHVTTYPEADGLPVYRSDDGGRTFRPISDAYPYGQPDKQWMAVDQRSGAIYVVTTDFAEGRGGSWFTRSLDGGFTWSPPVHLCGCYDPTIDLGGRGEIYVAALGSRIVVLRSLDGGLTWGAPVPVAPYTGSPSNPLNGRLFREPMFGEVGASKADASVYVVWHDPPPGLPSCSQLVCVPTWDIWISASHDGGQSWSAPKRVNDDPTEVMAQFMPQVAVSPKGDVHIAWFDQRLDPTGLTATIFYAHSADGERFDPNLLVSDVPFPVFLSHHQNPVNYPGNGIFLGDYIGVGATDGKAVVAFPDTRYGRADVFIATIE